MDVMQTTAELAPKPPVGAFTGRKRRATRHSVKVIDALMKYLICTGGIGVTIAFMVIVGFLFYVAVPLLRGPDIHALHAPIQLASPAISDKFAKPLTMGLDENLISLWLLDDQGTLSTYLLSSGDLVRSETVLPAAGKPAPTTNTAESPAKIAVTSVANNAGTLAIGLSNGMVRVGAMQNDYEFIRSKDVPASLATTQPGKYFIYNNGIATLTEDKDIRIAKNHLDLSEPLNVGPDAAASPVTFIDYLFTDKAEMLVALRADGRLFFETILKRENVMTGKIKRTVENYELPIPASRKNSPVLGLFVGVNGRLVYLVYQDGTMLRFNTDEPENAYVAEEVSLLTQKAGKLSAVRMLSGNQTLIVTDEDGAVSGWFPAPVKAGPRDKMKMTRAHVLETQALPAVAIAVSTRDRQFVTVDAKGQAVLRHMTSNTTQGKIQLQTQGLVQLVTMSPKVDAVAVLDDHHRLSTLAIHNPHADGSLPQMFSQLHYEGYRGPEFVYQSSAGSDDAEPKISLMPLIFGTLKATVYAMLFAVPVAILAAIYSSEFMQPQVRSVIKPVVELMSSLPSVVLGFIGALVFAPFVENSVLAMLLTAVTFPVTLVLFGFFWQFIPPATVTRVPAWLKFSLLFPLSIFSIWICFVAGPVVEKVLFAGDFKAWLSGSVGTATPGWAALFVPIFFLILTLLYNVRLKPFLKFYQPGYVGTPLIIIESLRYVLVMGIAIIAAVSLGYGLSRAGLDLRGSLIGPYVQRNSLIVGLMMGFAIIPIIYTVSEDALSSVPNTLRSAALGAGATPWQTAILVVLPVATSGIFSACMIGLGRAAGETMIVLMASGRTPIMDLNIFNGLSALSANIATELPEAPVGSTHYRVLFVSALVLFVLTFIVNTTAEIIRQRFRKRAYQL